MDRTASPDGSVQRTSSGPWLLDVFSSVWTGITLLVLLFVYSSIGSALYPVRQHAAIDLTEMEWFHWWPFQLLVGLFALNLSIVTIRRIPLRWTTAGVWMIHSGILILCAGSVYYFSTKLEGDTPIFRRAVEIRVPGAKQPLRMLALPGNQASLTAAGGVYRFQIGNIQPQWPLRSAPHEGQTAYSVPVMVQTPQQHFTRQLLAGFPQYTEDIIPGQGRAVKATGRKLLDESLELSLEYEPQEHFYLRDTSALYLRPQGASDWTERPIRGLPHFNDRVGELSQVAASSAALAHPLRPIDLAVPPGEATDPFDDVDIRVVGYLRYALERPEWSRGGDQLNPVLGMQLRQADETLTYQLAAFDPAARTAEERQIAFRWVESPDRVQELLEGRSGHLDIEVPGADVQRRVPIRLANTGPEVEFTPIEGTNFQYRVSKTIDNLSVPDGRMVSIAIVEIRTPEGTFTRWVADDPTSTKDLSDSSAPGDHPFKEPDPRIRMSYTPGPSNLGFLTIVAGPEPVGLHLLVMTPDGIQHSEAQVGKPIQLSPQVSLEISYLYPRARKSVKPVIVPINQRDPDARKTYSMVEVVVTPRGGRAQRLWLPFNHYAMPNEQYAYPGRVFYQPRTLTLPDGRSLEMLYSREREPLPAPVVLEDFTLLTHQGGLVGTNSNVRDYISKLRFADAGGSLGEPVTMHLNNPAAHAGFWFFQNTWDPPTQRSAGMNYTGAGVGNRNGVHVQLMGTIIAVLGMLYTFYVKPIILRRRRAAVYDQLEQQVAGSPEAGQPARQPAEPQEVSSRE